MKSRILMYISSMTLFVTLAMPVRPAAQEQQQEQTKEHHRYRVTDLGTLGGTFSLAFGINNRGWVDGQTNLQGDNEAHAFLWREGVMTDLGTLGGPNSSVGYPPNERGKIAGYSDTSTPDPLGEDFCFFGTHLMCLPFLWQKDVITSLPTLGGDNGWANQINNWGIAVGVAENGTSDPTCLPPQVLHAEPVLWEKGVIQQLPTFPGDPDGFVNAINDKGQAVGASGNCFTSSAGFAAHALLWENGSATDLGNLGGTMNNIPQFINNEGQVVGYSNLTNDTTTHAFLWTEDSGIQDLGTLPGDFSSFAYGINGKGQAVGASVDASGNNRAFLRQSGVMTDLNTLIPAGSPLFLLTAFDISSRGEIVGLASQKSTGQGHAFLATPCERDDVNTEGCRNDDADTPRTRSGTNESPKVTLPDNVRKLLQRRLPFGRVGTGPMRPQ